MSAHDRYLAGRRTFPVHAVCKCGHEWDDTYLEEHGTGWLEDHQECPRCGNNDVPFEELDELDIEERRLESRGENF